VIAIDLVMQARNGLELVIEFEDLAQIADTGCVNSQFDHDVNDEVTFMPERCKIRIMSARNTRSGKAVATGLWPIQTDADKMGWRTAPWLQHCTLLLRADVLSPA
jgi:hypothetical protein